MRKQLLSAALILFSAVSHAQLVREQPAQTPGGATAAPTTETGDFKPNSGSVSFEMNFNPFSASPLNINYLRARLFVSDDFAIRAGFSIASRSESDNKTFEYAVLPGVEKHFNGTERLSPFLGAELMIAGRGSSSSVTNGTVSTTTTKGVWSDGKTDRGFFNLGVNLLAGCDFYFAKHFYVGLEAGYGFSLISYSDIVVTYVPNGGSSTITTTEGGSSFRLGPNYNSALRLGFIF